MTGKTFPAVQVHAQPAILRIWQEDHGIDLVQPEYDPVNTKMINYSHIALEGLTIFGITTGIMWFIQVTATDLKIGHLQMKSTGTRSSNELQWRARDWKCTALYTELCI